MPKAFLTAFVCYMSDSVYLIKVSCVQECCGMSNVKQEVFIASQAVAQQRESLVFYNVVVRRDWTGSGGTLDGGVATTIAVSLDVSMSEVASGIGEYIVLPFNIIYTSAAANLIVALARGLCHRDRSPLYQC